MTDSELEYLSDVFNDPYDKVHILGRQLIREYSTLRDSRCWCRCHTIKSWCFGCRDKHGKQPAKMDAALGPKCGCGKASRHESGWCGDLNCKGEL